ncbi:VWA domain-containing protein [Candidatus Woesearchaeota archaeon]|nr:MAG: VWA domain-containing protein [Candidatus Woesearchaeota archaeon]
MGFRKQLSTFLAGALAATGLATAQARITFPTQETIPWHTPICFEVPAGSTAQLFWKVPEELSPQGRIPIKPENGSYHVPLNLTQSTIILRAETPDGETLEDKVTTGGVAPSYRVSGGDSVVYASTSEAVPSREAFSCTYTPQGGEPEPCDVVDVVPLGREHAQEPFKLTYLLVDVSSSVTGAPKAKKELLDHLKRLNKEVENATDRKYVLGVFNNEVPDVYRTRSLRNLIEEIEQSNPPLGDGGASPICKTISATLVSAYSQQQQAIARGLEPVVDVVVLSDFFDERDVHMLSRGDPLIDEKACEQAEELAATLQVPVYTISIKSSVRPNFRQEELAQRSGGGSYDDRKLGETLDTIANATQLRVYFKLKDGKRLGRGRVTLSVDDRVVFDGIREPRSKLDELVDEAAHARGTFEFFRNEVERYRIRGLKNAEMTEQALPPGVNPQVYQWLENQKKTFQELEGKPLYEFEQATPLGNNNKHKKALELMRADPREYVTMRENMLNELQAYTAQTLLLEPAHDQGDKREQRALAKFLAREVYPFLEGHPGRTPLDRMLDVYLNPSFPSDEKAVKTLRKVYTPLRPPCE